MAIFNDFDNKPIAEPILPDKNTDKVTQVKGTGYEDIDEGSHYSKSKSNIVSSVGSAIGSAVGYALSGSGLGQGIEGAKNELNKGWNDVKSMIADPRYAIYKGVNLLKKSINGEFDPDGRIMPDLNDRNPLNPPGRILAGKGINAASSLDPTGGMLTTMMAKKIKGALKNANNNGDWDSIILQEFLDRRQLDTGEPFEEAPLLADFSDEDPATGTFNEGSYGDIFYSSCKGYKTVQGLTIGTNYLWDITLDNYFPRLFLGNNATTTELGTYAPKIPEIKTANKNQVLGNFIPAIGFDYKDYSTLTTEIGLNNNASLELIAGLKRTNRLTIDFLDDENFIWYRYFDKYMKCIYDRVNNCTAPYKQSVLRCQIALYNPARRVYFKHDLLVIPIDFERRVAGEESPNAFDFSIEFCVVGDKDKEFVI